jgi:hypothetical protein
LERQSDILGKGSKFKEAISTTSKTPEEISGEKQQTLKDHFVSFTNENYEGEKFHPKGENLVLVLYDLMDLSL